MARQVMRNVASPYCDTGGTGYLSARGSKPIDFSQFRASSYNDGTAQDQTENPPNFTVARFIDDSHAVAGGGQAMLWRIDKRPQPMHNAVEPASSAGAARTAV